MKNSNEIYAATFLSQLVNPLEWQQTAKYLLESASQMENEINKRWGQLNGDPENYHLVLNSLRIQNVYMLLIAYAIENILKSEVVRLNCDSLKTETKVKKVLPKILKNHDLVELAKLAGVKITNTNELLLIRLTRCSTWAGRYPIPTTAPKSIDSITLSNGYRMTTSFIMSNDILELRGLVVSLSQQFNINIF